ncbi:SDR family NAD(P)-dependent oxidoreductase [Paenibacillus pseudetheri]|uniref:Dihydroanticapsin 7-dehydrogenase n=1 Tax=Paenibacillus pseudetheri TaxID=2897682 RepID=A0ABN8FUE0_9BACL|nr:SDR family oxidoreductase [Paenibacillus pseudetheri]CAH1058741.1 Dihydroanticapsin 7-dehydrogenase [Paenibacillus pseudetheri]
MQLQGKVVIVTGGGSGIGEATAKLLASEGAKVIIADWNDAEANRVVKEIQSVHCGNPIAFAVKTDVSSEIEVKQLVELVLNKFGRIDILFNNAAVVLPKSLEDISESEWTRTLDINLKSVYLMIKFCIPSIRENRGCIVNMASLSGLVGQKQNPVYSASKGAIIAMTKSLALDYASDGVRVNCICPAGVITPLLEEWIGQQPNPAVTVQDLIDMHPLGRCASTEEIARAVLYLASDLSGFVTGVALPVDGGASLGY